MHAAILTRTFFRNFAKNASSPSIDAMLSTASFTSYAATVAIVCFLSLKETVTPDV